MVWYAMLSIYLTFDMPCYLSIYALLSIYLSIYNLICLAIYLSSIVWNISLSFYFSLICQKRFYNRVIIASYEIQQMSFMLPFPCMQLYNPFINSRISANQFERTYFQPMQWWLFLYCRISFDMPKMFKPCRHSKWEIYLVGLRKDILW